MKSLEFSREFSRESVFIYPLKYFIYDKFPAEEFWLYLRALQIQIVPIQKKLGVKEVPLASW